MDSLGGSLAPPRLRRRKPKAITREKCARELQPEEKPLDPPPRAALYPLVTIVLAVVLLRERLNRVQLAGLALVAIWRFNVPVAAVLLFLQPLTAPVAGSVSRTQLTEREGRESLGRSRDHLT